MLFSRKDDLWFVYRQKSTSCVILIKRNAILIRGTYIGWKVARKSAIEPHCIQGPLQ